MELWYTKLVREKSAEWATAPAGRMRGPRCVAEAMDAVYGDSPVEHFVAFLLNARHAVTAVVPLTTGVLDASLIHPRRVFQSAILGNAAAVILAHNHPSGDPTPSAEDKKVTLQLVAAGTIIGIPVVDHVVVGSGGRFVSLSDKGLI